jgi:hypothetical protein
LILRKLALVDWGSILLLGIILSTSLRPAFKYAGGLPVFLAFSFVVVYLYLSWSSVSRFGRTIRLVSSRLDFQAFIIAVFAVLTAIYYPLADALKLQMLGQDQDDCLIQGAGALLDLRNPYLEPTYFGNPCSPLPGAIVPYLPFVALGVFSIAGPFFFAIAILLSGRALGLVTSGLMLALLASTPLLLELLVNGSDFVWMGFGLVVSIFALDRKIFKSHTLNDVMAIAIFGLLASTRVNMPILLGFFLVFLLARRDRRALWMSLAASVIAILPSALIYFNNPEAFTPLHLVGKGERLLPGVWLWLMIGASILSLAVVWYGVKRRCSTAPLVLAVLSPSVISLSVSDLVARGWDFADWEAASYLMVLIPLLALVLATRTKSRFQNLSKGSVSTQLH